MKFNSQVLRKLKSQISFVDADDTQTSPIRVKENYTLYRYKPIICIYLQDKLKVYLFGRERNLVHLKFLLFN